MIRQFVAILGMAFLLTSCNLGNFDDFADRVAAGEARAVRTLQKGFRAYCKVPRLGRDRVRAALNADAAFTVTVICRSD